MSHEIELTDAEAALVAQAEELIQERGVGAVPIPPFVLALIRKFAGPPLLAEVARHVIREEVPKGGGKTLAPGHEVKHAEFNARGGAWENVSRLKGPSA